MNTPTSLLYDDNVDSPARYSVNKMFIFLINTVFHNKFSLKKNSKSFYPHFRLGFAINMFVRFRAIPSSTFT